MTYLKDLGPWNLFHAVALHKRLRYSISSMSKGGYIHMKLRWPFVFILLILCIMSAAAAGGNGPFWNHNAPHSQHGQHWQNSWYQTSPIWQSSWQPSWYSSWYSSWPSWQYYSTPVWQYTTPVVQYSVPTTYYTVPATTTTTRYYSLSMTRSYSFGSTSLISPVGLWW